MANIELFFPKILQYESEKFTNDPTDHGGATKMGVTLNTWRDVGYDKDGDGDIDANDIRLLTREDALMVLKVGYWDRWRADNILNQSIAEQLVDWTYTSGAWGIKIPQQILGVTVDGRVGMQTIAAVNKAGQQFFDKVKEARITFFERIVLKDSTQAKYLAGWKNRANKFTYKA